MSDLAIAALSGAGVTVTVAIAMLYLGLRLSSAEQSAADARVDSANRRGQGAIDAATIAQLQAQLKLVTTRAEALDDELAKQGASGDVVGAHARVLQRWQAERMPDGAAGNDTRDGVHPASDAAPADKPKPVG